MPWSCRMSLFVIVFCDVPYVFVSSSFYSKSFSKGPNSRYIVCKSSQSCSSTRQPPGSMPFPSVASQNETRKKIKLTSRQPRNLLCEPNVSSEIIQYSSSWCSRLSGAMYSLRIQLNILYWVFCSPLNCLRRRLVHVCLLRFLRMTGNSAKGYNMSQRY